MKLPDIIKTAVSVVSLITALYFGYNWYNGNIENKVLKENITVLRVEVNKLHVSDSIKTVRLNEIINDYFDEMYNIIFVSDANVASFLRLYGVIPKELPKPSWRHR